MTLEKHDLVHEFPESKETIHHLKINDHHFARMFNEYNDVEHAVHRIETGAEHTSDEELETLKKQRLHLKDQLSEMIRDYESTVKN